MDGLATMGTGGRALPAPDRAAQVTDDGRRLALHGVGQEVQHVDAVGGHPVVPHHRALVVGGAEVVAARVHLGDDARPLPPHVGDAEERAVGGVELRVVHRLGQVGPADQRHEVAFGGGPAAGDALPQRHPVQARSGDRAAVELGDQRGDIAAAVLYRLGDERADVAQAGHGPGRVGDGASQRHVPDRGGSGSTCPASGRCARSARTPRCARARPRGRGRRSG